MNFELVAQIIFITSFFGIGWIIFRKIPVLVELPEELPRKEGENLITKLKKKIKEINPFKNFSYEIFLEKILRRIRILTLKTDNKTFSWLRKLKEKYQKKKIEKNDDYWEELKKSTNQVKKKTKNKPR